MNVRELVDELQCTEILVLFYKFVNFVCDFQNLNTQVQHIAGLVDLAGDIIAFDQLFFSAKQARTPIC